MNIIKRQTINVLGEKYPRAKKQLDVWYHEVKKAKWNDPADIKKEYPKASILKNKRVVFDIVGGEYRLIVKVEYDFKAVFIMFFGTHQEYDKINAETVSNY
ncbi:MAG: type II toxin-antitoxin system HigB family toxin [Cytophagaceae bacterium]